MDDDVLLQANDNFTPTKVTNVSSLMMQGKHYYYYYYAHSSTWPRFSPIKVANFCLHYDSELTLTSQ